MEHDSSVRREWVAPGVARCPTCHGAAGVRDDGALASHQRYADGAGPYPNQPHGMIQCAGEFTGTTAP